MTLLILSLTLNPALVKTSIVDGFELNHRNEIIDYRIEFDDGAIHAANIIKLLQGEPLLMGFAGGPGGRFIKSFLDKNKIKSDFTWMDVDVKYTQIIIDAIDGTETFLVDQGIKIDEKIIKIFFQKLQKHINDVSVLLLSGDIPKGFEEQDLTRIVDIGAEKNKRFVASLEGKPLKAIVEHGALGLLLTEKGLYDLGLYSEEEHQMIANVYDYFNHKSIKHVALDLGLRGIYTFTKNKVCLAKYNYLVEETGKKGITDGILGCFALGLDRGYEQEKLTKWMCGVSIASRRVVANELCQRKDIDYYTKKVKVTEIMNKSKGFITV